MDSIYKRIVTIQEGLRKLALQVEGMKEIQKKKPTMIRAGKKKK